MANTYTQLYIHFVFAVKYRQSLIAPEWEQELHKYITGIIENKGHKMLAINGMPDHLHLFIGYQPVEPMTELIKVVKGESSKWIKEKNLTGYKFKWQTGYGAFSHSKSQIDRVCKYILNQKKHHERKTFRKEYIQLLNDFGVDYDEKYLFDDVMQK